MVPKRLHQQVCMAPYPRRFKVIEVPGSVNAPPGFVLFVFIYLSSAFFRCEKLILAPESRLTV